MGVFDGGKKAGRFVFMGMPKAILGVNALKLGNQVMGSLWKSLSAPHCPECATGVLCIDPEVDALMENQERKAFWYCVKCNYSLYGAEHRKVMSDFTQQLRLARLRAQTSGTTAPQREGIAAGHQRLARGFLTASCLGYLFALFTIATGGSTMSCINIAVLSTSIFVMALTRSFRAWQARTGTLFVEGAFINWLKNEKWFS